VTGLVLAATLTIDTYSNIYVSGGLAGGAETPSILGLSSRLSAGYLLDVPSFTEAELEDFLRGISLGGGAGYVIGADLTLQVSRSPDNLQAIEPGLYTPQAGGGVNYTFLFWDAEDTGYTFKWPWQ
jgi:hypothetical protein